MIKKLILSLILIIILRILCIGGCQHFEKSTIKKDNEFVNQIMRNDLHEGMRYSEFKKYFEDNNVELNPYRHCVETENEKQKCEEFQRLITVLPLPSNNYWLGKGDVQIYITISNTGIVENIFHEIYYPRHH